DKCSAVDAHFRCQMNTPEEAHDLVEAIHTWRERQLAEVEKLRPNPSADVVFHTLEGFSTAAQDSTISGEVLAPADFPEALGEVVELWVGQAFGAISFAGLVEGLRTLLVAFCTCGAVVLVIALLLAALVVFVPARRVVGNR